METIGYAALQIIPSMKGVQGEMNRQLGAVMPSVGSSAGRSFSSSFSNALSGIGKVAGGAIAAVGVGTAGLGVAALKAGYGFNVLSQKASAAFTTLLGSQEKAAGFMKDIAEFSSTSPFSRSTFIEGAQIMSAFGYEAEKIIPTMSAVQDAIAASGGNDQMLSETLYVLAQIQSAGKITATDLMQLGQRGINAADLIGSQMGKTGAQIKEDISAGALDAGVALDALATGMAQKFDGAADGLKKTWAGAADSVNSALRYIGSDLIEPFISQAGGGAAVRWANTVADVLRSFRRGPIQDAVAALDKLVIAGDKFFDAFGRLADDKVMANVVDLFGRIAPAATGGATALALFSSRSVFAGVPILGKFLAAVNPLAGGLAAMALATPAAREALVDVFQAVAPLVKELAFALLPSLEATSDVAGGVLPSAIRTFGGALEVGFRAVIPIAELVGVLTGALSSMTPVLASGAAAWVGYKVAVGGVAVWTAAATGVGTLSTAFVGLRTAMAGSLLMFQAAGGGLAGLRASLLALAGGISVVGAVTAGLAAIAAAVVGANAVIASAQSTGRNNMREFIDSLRIDPNDVESIDAGYKQVADRIAQAQETMGGTGGWTRFWQRATPFTTNEWDEAKAEWDEGQRELDDRLNRLMELSGGAQANLGMDDGTFNSWIGKLGIDLGSTTMTVDELTTAIGDAAAAAQNGTPGTDALTDAYAGLADATADSTEKLADWKKVVDRIIGAPLGMLEAQADLAAALDKTNKVITENGVTLDVSTEKGREVIGTLSTLQGALIDGAVAYGDLNGGAVDAAAALQQSVSAMQQTWRQGGMTEEKIQALTAAMGLVPENIATVVEAATGDAQKKLDEVNATVKGMDGKIVTIGVKLQELGVKSGLDAYTKAGNILARVKPRRWGAIDQAHIGSGDLIRYAEPQTGGEAYIPRLGDKERSKRILQTAAGWYGGVFVSPEEMRRRAWPMARGGLLHARETPAGESGGGITFGDINVAGVGKGRETGAEIAAEIHDKFYLSGMGAR